MNSVVFLWADPATKRSMRIAFTALIAGTAVLGGVVGYSVARLQARKRNPRRRR